MSIERAGWNAVEYCPSNLISEAMTPARWGDSPRAVAPEAGTSDCWMSTQTAIAQEPAIGPKVGPKAWDTRMRRHSRFFESMMIVTGPSLIKSTCMSAPNSPVWIGLPRSALNFWTKAS